jgi:hypothetical protein
MDLAMDRGGVVRAGNALIRSRVLCVQQGLVGLHGDLDQWDRGMFPKKSDDAGHLWINPAGADKNHRKPMTGIIASDDARHRFSVELKTGIRQKTTS